MRRSLSPRDLAAAIGVSESSLKRWADAGRIQVSRTEGGHRRIPISEAVRFIRASGLPLVRPDLLGLGLAIAAGAAAADPAGPPDGPVDEALFHHLQAGDGRAARNLLVARFLAGESVAALGDGPIRLAMTRLGELWRHDARGVFIEHRATDCCIQAINAVRELIDTPDGAPVAVGAAPAADIYMIPTLLAATTLASDGLDAVNLGADTPIASLRHAVAAHRPAMVWLSCSVEPSRELVADVAALARWLRDDGRTLVIGGRHVTDLAPARAAVHVGSMAELAAFGRGLVSASATPR